MEYKFSIIVPIYNCEKYIDRCLQSVFNQSYENYEVIIIDDGSTDNSYEKIKKYSDKSNVTIISKTNSGVSDTRNIGIKKAKGEWITFIDADDWIEENTLEKINNTIEKNQTVDVIMSNLFINNGESQIKKYELEDCIVREKKELIETTIAIDYGEKKFGTNFGNCRCIGGKFYKLKIIKENNINFPTEISSFEDGIFNLYIEHFSKEIYIIGECYYHYFINQDSRTNTLNEDQMSENEKILNEINIFLSKFKIDDDTAINYCFIDLFSMTINNLEKTKNIKKLKEEIEKNRKYINSDIKYRYLSTKNKIVFLLTKKKMVKLLYFIYKIKNIIKRKTSSK